MRKNTTIRREIDIHEASTTGDKNVLGSVPLNLGLLFWGHRGSAESKYAVRDFFTF
jgi:hypothetical protein